MSAALKHTDKSPLTAWFKEHAVTPVLIRYILGKVQELRGSDKKRNNIAQLLCEGMKGHMKWRDLKQAFEELFEELLQRLDAARF